MKEETQLNLLNLLMDSTLDKFSMLWLRIGSGINYKLIIQIGLELQILIMTISPNYLEIKEDIEKMIRNYFRYFDENF